MTPTFYIGLVLVVVTWALLSHTSFGLAVTAVGEDPSAADKAGVDVNRSRYLAVLYAGAMAGVAGAFLSVADLDTFTEGMTKGAGYLALASVIFGGWTSWRTAVACLLFGAATALQFLLPDLGISVPVPLLLMLPYVMALLAVGGLVGNIRTPSALGIPFIRGR
jgi:general nucleoside transport system permease protein